MPKTTSKDGTIIVYEKTGSGPSLILVNGALAHRKFNGEEDLASLLSEKFTVIYYDRRGRGESSDATPYAVDREIEDIEALVKEAGGKAYLYGSSSGASLALLAAEKLGPEKIAKLVMYEPPYGSDGNEDKHKYATEKKKINELVKTGKPGDAVTVFMESRGMPVEAIQDMKKSPAWKEMERVGPTLVYDFEVLGDGAVPVDIAKNVTIPTQVLVGEKSFDFMHATADSLRKVIPDSNRKTLKDQTHEASPEVLAPVLEAFFGSER
jgi:pimeloyl-ACP methyl ester carboxylesterase